MMYWSNIGPKYIFIKAAFLFMNGKLLVDFVLYNLFFLKKIMKSYILGF